jgi:hypothetical protein
VPSKSTVTEPEERPREPVVSKVPADAGRARRSAAAPRQRARQVTRRIRYGLLMGCSLPKVFGQ